MCACECAFSCCLCVNIAIFLFSFFKGLGKHGVLFYNSLIIVLPTLLASAFTGDLHKVQSKEFAPGVKSNRASSSVFSFASDHLACCGTAGSHVRRLGRRHVYNVLPHVLLHGVGAAARHTARGPVNDDATTLPTVVVFSSPQVCADVLHSPVQLLQLGTHHHSRGSDKGERTLTGTLPVVAHEMQRGIVNWPPQGVDTPSCQHIPPRVRRNTGWYLLYLEFTSCFFLILSSYGRLFWVQYGKK